MPKVKLLWSDLLKAVEAAKEAGCKTVGFEARAQFTETTGPLMVNIEIEIGKGVKCVK